MDRRFGPYGLPWEEILRVPEGGRISIADPFNVHRSRRFGSHFDVDLLERRGGRLERVDRMHVGPSGNILDP